MRVLLTGVTGFVGRCLLPMLVQSTPDIEILTLSIDLDNAINLFPYSQCHHVYSTDFKSVEGFNPEAVIHLATVTTERNDTSIIHPMLAANIEFGVMLLDTLRRCPALRLFINTGSFAEYRLGTTKINDAYLYTATKTAFRVFCDYYSELSGYKYITVVPYSIYGGSPTVKRLMDYIIESMSSDVPVDMTEGKQVLDFIHVTDVAQFYVCALGSIDAICSLENGAEFHLGTGQGTSIRGLVEMMEHIFNRKANINWGGRPYRERDIMYAVAPIEQNPINLKWQAKVSIKEGIQMMKNVFFSSVLFAK